MLCSIFILIILCIIFFYLVSYSKEDFVNNQSIPIDDKVIEKYNKFINFYNPFLQHWEEALMTMTSLEHPPKEATSPSQSPSSAAKQPTREEMNQTVQLYSQKLGKSFPYLTDPLSNNIYSYSLVQLLKIIPSDPIPYQNALSLMNERLTESLKSLDSALKGQMVEGFLMVEGYAGDQCAELSTCFAQNPQIAEQIAKAQLEQEIKQQQQQQNQLSTRLDQFILNNTLIESSKLNDKLVQQSKEVQNKAQSGELLNMINIPDENPIAPYKIPEGGDRLRKMKESDPEKYKELEKNNSSLFSLKSLYEQINQNLRN
jgi:hypothetical protein